MILSLFIGAGLFLATPSVHASANVATSQWTCMCQMQPTACEINANAPEGVSIPRGCEAFLVLNGLASKSARVKVDLADPEVDLRDLEVQSVDYTNAKRGYQDIAFFHSQDKAFLSDLVATPPSGKLIFLVTAQRNKKVVVKSAELVGSPEVQAPNVGTLVDARHQTRFRILPGKPLHGLWLPLPMDYASQVPLSLKVKIDPPESVESIHYETDTTGNFGIILNLRPFKQTTEFSVTWDSVVLTRQINESERSKVYGASEDPQLWLRSSKIIQSDDPEIVALARTITHGFLSPEEKVKAIVNWTSTHITGTKLKGLDALSVLHSRAASCTGFANLAAALGRAARIPSRPIANYLVGMSQQTHSIDEFYLGPALGWRRVEPQSQDVFVMEDYGVIVRIVRPDDERIARERSTGMAGVPYKTILEILEPFGGQIENSARSNSFPDCPACDNRADHLALFHGSASRMISIFNLARKLWHEDQTRLLLGQTIPVSRDNARTRAASASNMDELEAVLIQAQDAPSTF